MAGQSETLKRYLEEDADDLRIIEEARKRMKVRQEQRTIDSPTSASLHTDGNDHHQHNEPPVKVEGNSSFEIGRNLDDVPTSDQASTSEYATSLSSSPADAIVDIRISNPGKVHSVSCKNFPLMAADGTINFCNIVKLFSQSHEHSEPDVVLCGACCALPDDPVLTDCLHLYCAECFTELLIRYDHRKWPVAAKVVCEAQEGDEITNYIKLTGKMFKFLASSVNLDIEGRHPVPIRDPEAVGLHTCGNASMGLVVAGPPSELDDITALWDVVVKAKDHSNDYEDSNEDNDKTLCYHGLSHINTQHTPRYDENHGYRPAQRASCYCCSEKDSDGFDDEDDRSDGYETSSDGEGSSSEGQAKGPFINDGLIKRPFYASESEDLNSDSDSSDEFGDNVSEISRTEVRKLRNEMYEWRPELIPRPAPRSVEQRLSAARQGWPCANITVVEYLGELLL
jgi:hypothetical protein